MKNIFMSFLISILSVLMFSYSALADGHSKGITIVLVEQPDIVDPCEATRSNVGKVIKQNVVETLVEIGFSISIQVSRDDNLIATGDIDLSIDNLQAQRLKQSGGNTLPDQFTFVLIDTFHNPDIAIPRTDRSGLSIFEEIMTGSSQLTIPRILEWQRQLIDRKNTVMDVVDIRTNAFRPARWSSTCERM